MMIAPIVDALNDIQVVNLSEYPEIVLRASEDDNFQKIEKYINSVGFSTKSNSFLARSNTLLDQKPLRGYTFIQEYTKPESDEKAVITYTIHRDNSATAESSIAKNEEPYCWVSIGDDGDVQITKRTFLLKVQTSVLKILAPIAFNMVALASRVANLLEKGNREQ
ncbi:hypothetical protein D0962_37840 [Leptolyngbyaceae cyanobacterium CCMR0082]|uniref:Uncharacterized protein n=2 Tax=Adonisia TaxID=2950183 RepID=A0A6M0SJK0_9CYAN|nr:hypothetical protein [Adonisia turfae CCMR0082]